jgi:sortase A
VVQWFNLRRLNNILFGLIVLINLYIIIAPFTPAIVFWYQQHHERAKTQQLSQKIQTTNNSSNAVASAKPEANQVIIPSILLDQTINEGSQMYQELDKGIWRWPSGSTPDKGGNTILIGHRFTYTNPRGVLYELNEVKLGDEVGIIWNNVTYDYEVSSINQVSPHQTSILNQSQQPEVTLYTCTPLVDPKYRLVVVATLESKS